MQTSSINNIAINQPEQRNCNTFMKKYGAFWCYNLTVAASSIVIYYKCIESYLEADQDPNGSSTPAMAYFIAGGVLNTLCCTCGGIWIRNMPSKQNAEKKPLITV